MGNCLGNSAYFVGNLGKTVLVTLLFSRFCMYLRRVAVSVAAPAAAYERSAGGAATALGAAKCRLSREAHRGGGWTGGGASSTSAPLQEEEEDEASHLQ